MSCIKIQINSNQRPWLDFICVSSKKLDRFVNSLNKVYIYETTEYFGVVVDFGEIEPL